MCRTHSAQRLVRHAAAAGGHPLVMLKSNEINRALMLDGRRRIAMGADRPRRKAADAKRPVLHRRRGSPNVSELSDVPADKQKLYESTVWEKVHRDVRIAKTRWCVLRWPHPSMAQMAEMSTEAFEDFYFNVCTLDYAKMSRAMQPLKKLMERTDRVRLKGPGETDLTFSIKGIPGHLLRRPGEHPRRRSLHRPGAKQASTALSASTAPPSTAARRTTMSAWFSATAKSSKRPAPRPDKLNEVLDTDRRRAIRRRIRHRIQSVLSSRR